MKQGGRKSEHQSLARSMSHSHIIEFDAVNKVHKRKLCTTPFYPLPLALSVSPHRTYVRSQCSVAQFIFSPYCHAENRIELTRDSVEFTWMHAEYMHACMMYVCIGCNQ